MCGIVAIVKKQKNSVLDKTELLAFKQMLYCNALRGWDATGVASIKAGNKVEVLKEAVTSQEFLWNSSKTNLYDNAQILIGHNRAATKGDAKNSKNAHPFTEDHITLVHNGTLFLHKNLANTDVDSHAITIALAKETQDIKKVFSKLWGSYALVWYNKKDKLVYLVRNKDRPLFVVETKSVFVIVSEQDLAKWILTRLNLEIINYYTLEENFLYYIEKNTLYKDIKLQSDNNSFKVSEQQFNWEETRKKTLETLESNGIKVGATIDFIPTSEDQVHYKAWGIGHHRVIGHIKHSQDIGVEFITEAPIPWKNKIISATIKSISTYYKKDKMVVSLICHGNYTTKEQDKEKEPLSINNIVITDTVLKILNQQNCACCGHKFLESSVEKSKIIPIWGSNNKQPYRYTYVCPSCLDLWDDHTIYIGDRDNNFRQRMA